MFKNIKNLFTEHFAVQKVGNSEKAFINTFQYLSDFVKYTKKHVALSQ